MDRAQEILTYFSGPAGYLLFFVLVTACGCGFPFNSDITLITAAVLCANGIFQLWILMLLAFAAIMLGDSICFFVARKWGLNLLHIRPFRWVFSEKSVARATRLLNEHGRKFLFIVRFLPLIRSALFFAAGTLQVSGRSFYWMNGLATVVYVPMIMLSSYYASANIDAVLQMLKQFQFGLLAIFTTGIVFLFTRKKKTGAGNE
jgi:membrane-associated protein